MTLEQVTGPDFGHGEGPVWSSSWGGLRFVDLRAGDVIRLDADGCTQRWHVGDIAATIRPRAGGDGIVLALERGFALADGWGSAVEDLGEVWTDPGYRFNDGACDPDGGLLCASMSYAHAGTGGVMYRLADDGDVTPVFAGLGISNGLAWTADGRTAYHTDTLTRRIDRYDYDAERGLHSRRPFVWIPESQGWPDGLTVDSEGGVWVALWCGGAVHRYDADGRLDVVLPVPVRRVTACTFGGADLDELYVTTMRDQREPGEERSAGALFHCRPGVRGLPAREFGAGVPLGSPANGTVARQ